MDDLRRPTGFFFLLIGLILLGYALIFPGIRAALEPGVNVNLWCGLVLFLFGLCLLGLSLRAKS